MRKLLLPLLLLTGLATANELEDWFNTAAGNNTGSTPDYPIEGMAPSSVNDTMREMMAVLARNYEDTNGSITTAGAANTYTLAASATVSALAEGQTYLIEINATNTGASTLNVDSTGARDIVLADGGALSGGELQAGGRYLVSYDAGRNDYTLVGGFSDYTFDDIASNKLDITGTVEVDLVDTGNPFNIGSLSGNHLALDTNSIQGKSNPTTGRGMDINRLGGDVDLGPQSGNGQVLIWDDGVLVALGEPDGFSVRDGSGDQPVLYLRNDSGGQVAQLLSPTGGGARLRSIVHGGQISLQAEDTGGTNRSILIGDPDGETSLQHVGSTKLATAAGGVTVTGDVGTTTVTASGLVAAGSITVGGVALTEQIEDDAGGMFTGNTETNITATYQDGDGTVDLVVPSADDATEGVIETATTAETVAGSDSTRAITAAGFAGTKSLAQDGFYVLPGDLVIQWGSDSVLSNTTDTLSYPRAITTFYAGGCSYEGLNDTTIGDACTFNHSSSTQFQLTNGDDDGTRTITWWAYGLD